MVDGVSTDRHNLRGSQLAELRRRERPSTGGLHRRGRPLLRDGIEDAVDLLHRKRQQVVTHRLEVRTRP